MSSCSLGTMTQTVSEEVQRTLRDVCFLSRKQWCRTNQQELLIVAMLLDRRDDERNGPIPRRVLPLGLVMTKIRLREGTKRDKNRLLLNSIKDKKEPATSMVGAS